MEQTEKIGWLEQLKIACLKPSEYRRLLDIGKGRVLVFFMIVSFLITFLGFGMDMIGFSVSVGGTENFIMNRLPAFELKNGHLNLEESMDFEISGFHVAADTKKQKVDLNDLNKDYAVEALISRDQMVLKNTSMQQVVYTISFADFKDYVLNNRMLLEMKPLLYTFFVLLFFSKWIVNIIIYLAYCGFISMFAYMNQKMKQENTTFGQIFQMSIYARVVFHFIETMGMTAGMDFFAGTAWMLISYLGSYQLLMMTFMKKKKES
jgi:hypothetical protein